MAYSLQKRQKKLKDTIWNLEKVGSVSKLMALMKADVRAKKNSRTKGKMKSKSPRTKKHAGKQKWLI